MASSPGPIWGHTREHDFKTICGKSGALWVERFATVYSLVSGCSEAGGRTTQEAHRYSQAASVAGTVHREPERPSKGPLPALLPIPAAGESWPGLPPGAAVLIP